MPQSRPKRKTAKKTSSEGPQTPRSKFTTIPVSTKTFKTLSQSSTVELVRKKKDDGTVEGLKLNQPKNVVDMEEAIKVFDALAEEIRTAGKPFKVDYPEEPMASIIPGDIVFIDVELSKVYNKSKQLLHVQLKKAARWVF